MDIKDKLVLEWTNVETTDDEGRVVRTSTPNEAVTFVLDQYTRVCTTYGKPALPAWRKREEVRIQTGFYQTSSVVIEIEELTRYNHALHISRNDTTMVAYTPSVEAGNEDKQLTTTLGKFLRKHLLLVTDTWIADKVAQHMAEANGSFECARTAAEIRWAYTSMPSDTSCMRYQPNYWYNGELDVHPSEVYATDHTYVAYIPGEPDDDGKPTVKARAVVYEKGDDKRYVRVYGAPVLMKILERKGYRCDSLRGARLRRIPIPNMNNCYVMPYLDGPGGAQSDQNCYVVDDGEALTVVHRELALKYGDDHYAACKDHLGARAKLVPIPDPCWVSDMTGITYVTVEEGKPNYYITPIGTIGKASADEILMRRQRMSLKRVSTRHEGSNIYVWTYSTAPQFYQAHSYWSDNETNRKFLGHKRVSSKYDHLALDTWYSSGVAVVDHTGKEIHVSGETALVTIVGSDGLMRLMPAVCVPLLAARKAYRKCGRHNERDVYASTACSKLTRSAGGTWFVQGIHDGYSQCEVTGKWYATKALMTRTVWGRTVLMAKDQPFDKAALLAKNISVLEWHALANAEGLGVGTLGALLRSAEKRAATLVTYETGVKELAVGSDGSLFRDYYRREVTFSSLLVSLAAVTERCASGNWSEAVRQEVDAYAKSVDMVRAHFEPYANTLKATIARLDAEAAGQLVIEEGETV